MKNCVAEEETQCTKFANYELYKERMIDARKLKADIAEHKQEIDDFFLKLFEDRLEKLKQPIY